MADGADDVALPWAFGFGWLHSKFYTAHEDGEAVSTD